ncbi:MULTISPECIES: porin [Niastella]|uniref:Porin n=1 Tax=Niastella soli TaxID=2821487 RepID=A0ABS3YYB7_9BACT|nr:porin [Niastella soli]MBO9202919.1 porin [Niastella soli]
MKYILSYVAILSAATGMAQDTTLNEYKGKVTVSGYAEAYYSYDLSKPKDNNRPGFIYSHNRSNEFNINLAFIKANYTADRIRANIALGVGTYMNANYAAEPGVLKNIYEANVGFKLSRTRNFWLDMGIMSSHLGFESAVSKDCWALTRSLAADNSPYYESGAKLTYITNNNKWLFSAMALNGWQRIQRVNGNSLMSWGTQVQFRPTDKVVLNYSTFLGTDKPDSTRLWRYFHNLYGVVELSDKFGLTLGFDIGQEQAEKGGSELHTWYTPVAILQYAPVDHWAFAVRGEYYSDEHGVIINTGTPNGFKTWGYSANVDYIPIKNIALRLEGRMLNSKDDIFLKADESPTGVNTAITFSVAVNF